MTSYRYINRDHTLVLRDDHVIAWDARVDAPASEQATKDDEHKIWKDAGSPKPDLETILPPGQIDTSDNMDRPPWERQGQPIFPWMPMPDFNPASVINLMSELEKVEQALPKLHSDDVAGLRQQVQALAEVVHGIVGGRQPQEKDRK